MTTLEYSDEVQVIHGPTAPAGGVIYQVTLANGMVLTNPTEFGLDQEPEKPSLVISEDGQILSTHADSAGAVGTVV